ncbi:hypothetical protein GE21DRAFT_1210043, partial [Neurospora crassa]
TSNNSKAVILSLLVNYFLKILDCSYREYSAKRRVNESIVVREAFLLLFVGGVAVGIAGSVVVGIVIDAIDIYGFYWLIGFGAVLYERLLYDYCLVEIKDGKKRCLR